MRLADFPLLEPDVYFVRSDAPSPNQLKPLAEVKVWRDASGYSWLAQGDVLVEFERDLLRERVRSGIAAAKARGMPFGRRIGQRPKADRLAPKVLRLVEEGRSYRDIAQEAKLRKNTVMSIVHRNRIAPCQAATG